MHSLRIYDIDGTLTTPGNDLWYLVTRSLAANPSRFDNYVAQWKQRLKTGECPYEVSRLMMQQGIECMDEDCNAARVQQRAKELSNLIIQHNHYYPSAINHLCASIDAGFQIVFSTTNYCEGAAAFLEVLVERGLVQDYAQDSIMTSGSNVDWQRRSITHFNMGKDKLVGLSKALKIPINQLPRYTDSAYGDDPGGNDAGILSLVAKSFVIANPKNLDVPLPANLVRTSWEDILQNYF